MGVYPYNQLQPMGGKCKWVGLQETPLNGRVDGRSGPLSPSSLHLLCFLELDVLAESLQTFLHHEVNKDQRQAKSEDGGTGK